MNRQTSVYTITFDADSKGLDWVAAGLLCTLSGSGLGDKGTAFIRIRVKDDTEAVRQAVAATEGVVDDFEITTGVGIHRRSVDVDNIRRTLASQD